MRVELAYADPAREVLIGFDARPGSSVLDCVEHSGLFRLVPDLRDARLGFAVFGRRVEPTDPVSKGDRIEVLRPLGIDPKEARRLRARRASPTPPPAAQRPPDRRHASGNPGRACPGSPPGAGARVP